MAAGVKDEQLESGHIHKSHKSSSEEDGDSIDLSLHSGPVSSDTDSEDFTMIPSESATDGEHRTISKHSSKKSSCSRSTLVSMEIFEDNRHKHAVTDSSDDDNEEVNRRYRKSYSKDKTWQSHHEYDTDIDTDTDDHHRYHSYDSWLGDQSDPMEFIITDQSYIPKAGL